MRITFFIGNGFDLNIGLKTKYQDFYPYFIEKAGKDNMIKKWMIDDLKLWADLEERLGQEIYKVGQNDLLQYYSDKAEMDELLLEYLETEQNKFQFYDENLIKEEFKRSMNTYTSELTISDKESIENTKSIYKNEVFKYSFIIFNYTNILDRIISLFKNDEMVISSHRNTNGNNVNDVIGDVLHIHGTVEEEMILGVNDVNQINNDDLKNDSIFLNTFIKSNMNTGLGQRKTEKAVEIINQSHIVCVFGMSIGSTDKMWWEQLIKWLISNPNNKLIIFIKQDEKSLKRKIPVRIIRLIEENRRKLFDAGKGQYSDTEYDIIKNRIIIVFNANILSFSNLDELSKKDIVYK